MNLTEYLKYKKTIQEAITLHEELYPKTTVLLGSQRYLWDNIVNPDGRKTLSWAAKAHIAMGKIPRDSRYEIWSDLFGRTIQSAKELKLSEAIVLVNTKGVLHG